MLNKKLCLRMVVILFALMMFFPVACLSGNVPVTGDTFPGDDLLTPEEDVYQDYLGLDGSKETFKLRDIKADFVLVQIFSMYCPVCQREAPAVNDIYEMIGQSGSGDKLKLLGIAPGNSSFEVSVFRDRYDIPFPLIPDGDYVWHKIMGEVGTPYFVLVKLGTGEILMDNLGSFGTAQEFFEAIMEYVQ
jgi:peroxiredoxin